MPQDNGQRHIMSADPWPTERWTAILVLLALGILIAIRLGFRGVSFMGARVAVG